MTKKQTYSFGRFEDDIAATIFVIFALGAGVVSLFKSAGSALKNKMAQYKSNQR